MRRQPKRQPVTHRNMLTKMELAGLSPAAALAVASFAGVASFLSPCVAPLLPGYLAFVAGPGSTSRSGVLPRALGFVAGFVVLFALLGASAATLSRQLDAHRAELELVSGLVVALLGLAMVFGKSPMPTGAGTRMQERTSRMGSPASIAAAMPIGAAFAIAWSPCIGPALAAILTLAAGGASPAWGATLLVAYGIGLGIPFLLGAVALDRVHAVSRRLRRNVRLVNIVCGLALLVLGLAIATGSFGSVTARLARSVPDWML